ncbi:hypothetical protein [Luteolibacter sp. AS25]|uniref:hypothetical protein n=1 Tax=Luteolibacter sp. AS25 TaxID=3135776 RepID=UPI00398A6E58
MTQRHSTRILAKVALAVVILVGIVFLLRPNREAKALSLVGYGTIIDSETQVIGTSSQYWARIACDPEEVREFLKRSPYVRTFSLPDKIQDKFSDGFMKWPSNFSDYSDDLVSYEVGTGRFALVAFNDKGDDEVLYVVWSH